MYKWKLKSNKLKIILTILTCSSFTLFSLFSLSSCGYISQNLLDKTIYKGDGTKIADVVGYDLNSLANSSIENSGGARSYLDNISNKLSLSWIDKIANSPNGNDYKIALENERLFIDKSYNEIYNSYKKTHGDNFDLIFQQEILDPLGGTEQSWKEEKLFKWARTELQTKIFSKDYLTTIDANGEKIQSPSETTLINSISGTTSSFAFSSKANESLSAIDSYLDPIYANFHKYIFDKWVEVENPFIINMSLWKYGTPKNGLNSIYLTAPVATTPPPDQQPPTNFINVQPQEGETPPTTDLYNLPYFSNANATSDAGGTIDRFIKFINNATNNYVSNANHGLIDIPQEYTEDSSTYILAKNGSIYNDLYIEFAAAATYLLYSGKTTAGFPNIANIDTDIQKTVSTMSTLSDAITSNFISTSSLNNRDIKIANSLSSQIINPDGEFGGLLNNNADLFITDAFKASDTKLNKFMFLRNEAGVHAIAIDGKNFIDMGTTISDYKKNAATIVLYRSLLNKNAYSDFVIDIKNELSNFFSNNFTSLLYQFANDQAVPIDLQMFTPITEFGVETNNFNILLNNYLFEESKSSRKKDFQLKMYEKKSKLSSNYGILSKDNGLAAPWIYSYESTNSFNYDLTNSPYSPSPFITNGSYQAYINSISSFINHLNLTTLSSNFNGFKYSQYIYTNNTYINYAILAYGSDGNSMANTIKSKILLNYLGNNFDNNSLSIQDSIFTNTAFNNQVGINLTNALNNFFFDSTFNGALNRWRDLNESKTTTTISYANLNTYRLNLWKQAIEISNSVKSDSYYNLHILVATIKYLLANNASKFLEYLQSQIFLGQDSYIAWYESENSFLNTTNTTVGNLFNINANNLIKNINNSYLSSYFGNTPSDTNIISSNTTNTIYSNVNSYYKYVGDSVGFVGLQTVSNNSAPTVIQERLFSKQNLNAQEIGSLYSYGTKDQLLNVINNFSLVSDIENLVTSLKSKIRSISFDSVANATTLSGKKQELNSIFNNSSNSMLISNLFLPRTGYISKDILSNVAGTLIEDTTSSNLKYGAKVIQINNSDVVGLVEFKAALEKNNIFNAQQSSNIFFNLVVQAASSAGIQNNMLNDLLSYNGGTTNRVDIYDVRLKEQLGVQWVKNWK